MAFKYTNQKGKDYFLHHTERGPRTLYFFKSEQGEGGLDDVPAGYTVAETSTGLPVLKKAGGEAPAANTSSGSKAKAGGTTPAAKDSSGKAKAGASKAKP